MDKLTLKEAIAELLDIEGRAWTDREVGLFDAYENIDMGEVLHPHTVALAKVPLQYSDDFSLTDWQRCPECDAWSDLEADIEHVSDCAWVQAKAWVA